MNFFLRSFKNTGTNLERQAKLTYLRKSGQEKSEEHNVPLFSSDLKDVSCLWKTWQKSLFSKQLDIATYNWDC